MSNKKGFGAEKLVKKGTKSKHCTALAVIVVFEEEKADSARQRSLRVMAIELVDQE